MSTYYLRNNSDEVFAGRHLLMPISMETFTGFARVKKMVALGGIYSFRSL
jgi:hypothetical protein